MYSIDLSIADFHNSFLSGSSNVMSEILKDINSFA